MAIRLVVRPPGGKGEYALTFDQQRVSIGRSPAADLRLPHAAVSEVHCVIRLEGQDYLIVDPGSTNGTTVNGGALVHGRPKLLRAGDAIGLCGFEVSFRAGAAMEGAHTAARTAAMARRMLQDALGALGPGGAPPRLVFLNGPRAGERIDLAAVPAVVVIGRGEDCDVAIDDADLSRRHCEIRRDWDGVTIADLGAKNPTRVGDEPVRERPLRDRDEILVGSTRLVFEDPAEAYLAQLARMEADAPLPEVGIPDTRVRGVGPGPADVSFGEDRSVRAAGSSSKGIEPPPVAPAEAPAASPRRTVRRGTSVGEWIVVTIGVLVLGGSVVAIVWVFQ